MYRWNPKVTANHVKEWRELYLSGLLTDAIAAKYDVDKNTVYRYLKADGVLKKRSESKKGAANPAWAGDKVSYGALHSWVRRNKPRPDLCEFCFHPPRDLANKSGEYKRDLDDWEWLCRTCHMATDGRLLKIGHYRKRRGTA